MQLQEKHPTESKRLVGRVVLITGASRGIGAATAKLLGHHGASIVVNYVSNVQAAQFVVDQIEQNGGKATAVQADVTNVDQIDRMVQQVTQQWGAIDTVVLNAVGGSTHEVAGRFGDLSWEQFDAIVTNQLKANFLMCKAVLPQMQKARSGCIIAVSSVMSRHPVPQFFAMAAAKSATDSMVRNLAADYGQYGIRVNAVAPALVETEASRDLPEEFCGTQYAQQMSSLHRVAQPEDIANAILMLTSPEASFITGGYLPVDGGWYMP